LPLSLPSVFNSSQIYATSSLLPAMKLTFYLNPSILISRTAYTPSEAAPPAFSIRNPKGQISYSNDNLDG